MSRHHVEQQWSTHSPKLRAMIKPTLPAPCVECGRPVLPEHKWQVGHRLDAGEGGRPTLANVGPVHVRSELWPRNCNQIAGGRKGAAKVNGTRRAQRRMPSW